MDAKELMIGDFIRTNDVSWSEDLQNRICKVEHIGHEYLACVVADEPQKTPYGHESSFEPIPLTKEILERNGFVLDTFRDTVGKWWIREEIGFGEHGELSVGGGRSWQNIDIKYVHQLQHALRLCGIKNIEL